jgi:hypothetical protein
MPVTCEWVSPVVNAVVDVTRFTVVAWLVVRVVEIVAVRFRRA